MRVLVLGGAGFLGKNLTKALLDEQVKVRVFKRLGQKNKGLHNAGNDLEWYYGDFLNHSEVEEAMQGCDVIYHLISTTLPKGSNDNPTYDVESNLIGSIRMMEAARDCGIKKIIYVSSGGTVYGIPEQTPIPETHPTDPICSYGITKLAIEKYLALFHANKGPDYTIIRLANPYGPYQSTEASQGAIAVFMQKALNHESVEIWGDGSVVRDYIYVGDVVNAMLRALTYDGVDKVFNIGHGEGHSINEILDAVEEVLDLKIKRVYSEARICDIPTNVLDIKKAKEKLNWEPEVELVDGIRLFAEYLKSI